MLKLIASSLIYSGKSRIGYLSPEGKNILALDCKEDRKFLYSHTNYNIVISSREVAKDMSIAYRNCPHADHISPFYGKSIYYTVSYKYNRPFNFIVDKALKEADGRDVYICGGSKVYEAALSHPELKEIIINEFTDNQKAITPPEGSISVDFPEIPKKFVLKHSVFLKNSGRICTFGVP